MRPCVIRAGLPGQQTLRALTVAVKLTRQPGCCGSADPPTGLPSGPPATHDMTLPVSQRAGKGSPRLLWIAVPVAGRCPTAAIAGSVLGMAHDLHERTSATCTCCGKTC